MREGHLGKCSVKVLPEKPGNTSNGRSCLCPKFGEVKKILMECNAGHSFVFRIGTEDLYYSIPHERQMACVK